MKCKAKKAFFAGKNDIYGCVYFTEVGLQEYIARSTHRARPKDNNPTFRKKRTARSEIRHR